MVSFFWISVLSSMLLMFSATARGDDEEENEGREGEAEERPMTEAERDGELLRAQEKMAELHEGKDDLKSALKVWRELLAQSPESPKYLAQVSRLCVDLGQFREALEPSRKLVRLRPNEVTARRQLVAALLGLGTGPRKSGTTSRGAVPSALSEALPHLEWLKARAPDDVESRQELAEAYETMKRPREALEQYTWLLARLPGNLEYRLARANVLGDLGREEEQLREFQQILPLLSRERAGDVHREIGEIYYHREDFQRAEQHLQSALSAAPADAKTRALLHQLLAAAAEARRRAAEEVEEAARYEDWMLDIQSRSEDF
jgi:tetratricopeptide (TPR) repeat protein